MRGEESSLRRAVKLLVLVAFALLLAYRGKADVEAVFAFYFLASLIYQLDPRYPVLAAIGSLLVAAVLLGQQREELANQVAIYAYYFLVVGVTLSLVEYVRESRAEEKPPEGRKLSRKVLAVVSGKGGVGKTTLATNLAVTLGRMGKKVLLVDMDIAMPNVDLAMGVEAESIDKVLEGQGIKEKHGCSVLSILPVEGGYRNREAVEKLRELIERLREEHEVVILDFPPGIEGLEVIDGSMDVVVIANPDRMSIADANNVKRTLEGRANLLGVVVNRAGEVDVDAVEELVELPVLAVLPEERRVAEAVEAETPVAAGEQECEFSEEVEGLASFLLRYWERREGAGT